MSLGRLGQVEAIDSGVMLRRSVLRRALAGVLTSKLLHNTGLVGSPHEDFDRR